MSDYIRREAAIEAMYKDAEAHPDHTFWTSQHEALMDIPAADVRPVARGVWVKNGWSIRCSICGYDMPFATRNFCPNCGADMREANDA